MMVIEPLQIFFFSFSKVSSSSRAVVSSPLWSHNLSIFWRSSSLSLNICEFLKMLSWVLYIGEKDLRSHNDITWQMSLGYSGLSSFSSAISRIYKIMTLNHNFLVNSNLFIAYTVKHMKKISRAMHLHR